MYPWSVNDEWNTRLGVHEILLGPNRFTQPESEYSIDYLKIYKKKQANKKAWNALANEKKQKPNHTQKTFLMYLHFHNTLDFDRRYEWAMAETILIRYHDQSLI